MDTYFSMNSITADSRLRATKHTVPKSLKKLYSSSIPTPWGKPVENNIDYYHAAKTALRITNFQITFLIFLAMHTSPLVKK